jgi:hypothetical protein
MCRRKLRSSGLLRSAVLIYFAAATLNSRVTRVVSKMAANVSSESAVSIFRLEHGGSWCFRNYEINAFKDYKEMKCINQIAILSTLKCIRLRVFFLTVDLTDIF